jgi:hypothetical protein
MPPINAPCRFSGAFTIRRKNRVFKKEFPPRAKSVFPYRRHRLRWYQSRVPVLQRCCETAQGEFSRNESPYRRRVVSGTRGREVPGEPSHTRQGIRSRGFSAAKFGKYVRAELLLPGAHPSRSRRTGRRRHPDFQGRTHRNQTRSGSETRRRVVVSVRLRAGQPTRFLPPVRLKVCRAASVSLIACQGRMPRMSIRATRADRCFPSAANTGVSALFMVVSGCFKRSRRT